MTQPEVAVRFEPSDLRQEKLELYTYARGLTELLPASPMISPYHPPVRPAYNCNTTVSNEAYNSTGLQPTFHPVPPRMLCRPQFLPKDIDARLNHEQIWIAVAKSNLRIAFVVPPTCKRCAANHHFCDRQQPACAQCRADGVECVVGGTWQPLKVYLKRKKAPARDVVAEEAALRIALNSAKPEMPMLKSVPVWADTRKAMVASLDYLSNPISTYGGSVEIAKSGSAKAIILEGHSAGFWGEGDQAGTIAVFLGGHAGSLARSALFASQKSRVPVAVIAAQDYSVLPYRLPRAYVVLGWFWIVDAWMEPQFGLKCRLEWCPDGPMWWSSAPERKANIGDWPAEPTDDTVRFTSNDKPGDGGAAFHCPVCRLWSEQVYTQPVCLNESCTQWFRISNPTLRPARDVPRKGVTAAGFRLRPKPPVAVGADYWSGFVCQHCGQAGQRTKWKHWECTNCLMEVLDRKILRAADLRFAKSAKSNDAAFIKLEAERSEVISPEGFKVSNYKVEEGNIYHARHVVVQSADSAFLELQGAATPFTRVEDFYHMLVGLEGIKWEDAPSTCALIRDLLNTRVRQALEIEKSFNMLLLHAVPQNGPLLTIAGSHPYSVLILGSDARVTFRRTKAKSERIDFNAQHGDVMGSSHGMILEVKMEGFGIVCVGRQNSIRQDKQEKQEPKEKKKPYDLKEWYIGPFPLQL